MDHKDKWTNDIPGTYYSKLFEYFRWKMYPVESYLLFYQPNNNIVLISTSTDDFLYFEWTKELFNDFKNHLNIIVLVTVKHVKLLKYINPYIIQSEHVISIDQSKNFYASITSKRFEMLNIYFNKVDTPLQTDSVYKQALIQTAPITTDKDTTLKTQMVEIKLHSWRTPSSISIYIIWYSIFLFSS